MKLDGLTYATIDWARIPAEEHPGEKGTARSKVHQSGDIRIRMVEYSPGYLADHWCSKGHVVLCFRGEFVSEHKDGSTHVMREGMTYIVGDGSMPHKSSTETGATLFIVD